MIHKYKYKDLYILLDINSRAVHVINEIVYDILDYEKDFITAKENLKTKYKEEELDKAIAEIQKLIDAGMLFAKDKIFAINSRFNKVPLIKAMCLHVAHDCNLKCEYCFASQGDFQGSKEMMSLDVAKKSMDFLVKMSGKRRNLEVDFFGGEPLMNFDVVKKTVAYARGLEKKHNKNFRFTLTTNGMLLSDDVAEFLNKEMDNVVLSIDGRRETNDLMRKTTNDKGSYDYIMPKFKKFVENRGNKSYYVRGTFTKFNLDFSEDVKHLADEGFKSISVEPVVSEPGLPYTIEEKHLDKILKEYEKLADSLESKYNGNDEYHFFHFDVNLKKSPCAIKQASGCGAGAEYVSVTPSGEIYPCHQFVGNTDFIIGNLEEGIIRGDIVSDFAKVSVFTKQDCKECWNKYYCSGGCHANAYNFNNDISIPYDIACSMQKKRVELAIYLAIKKMEVNNDKKT